MTREEALELTTFDHYCTCGGFAWSMNGRDPADPHMSWCPQREQYNEWYRLTNGETKWTTKNGCKKS